MYSLTPLATTIEKIISCSTASSLVFTGYKNGCHRRQAVEEKDEHPKYKIADYLGL